MGESAPAFKEKKKRCKKKVGECAPAPIQMQKISRVNEPQHQEKNKVQKMMWVKVPQYYCIYCIFIVLFPHTVTHYAM